ncbi:hypothetical protein PENTCL1PPCAC_8415, partial [Pristionchus entomophagus]
QSSSIFRSADMSLCQLFLQSDAAYHCIAELGESGNVQFRDLNKGMGASQRRFVGELRRCYELDRKLRYIENEIVIDDVEIHEKTEIIFTPDPNVLNNLEEIIEKIEHELITINNTTKSLKDSHIHLWELSQVIEKVQLMVDDGPNDPDPLDRDDSFVIIDAEEQLIAEDTDRTGAELRQVTGVIPRNRMTAFERLLWRMCSGSVFMRWTDCDDNNALFSGDEEKAVFVLFFTGDRMAQKVDLICRGSPARIYTCPDDPAVRQILQKRNIDKLNVMSEVIGRTLDYRKRVIAAASRSVYEWRIKVLKMKMVYHTLDALYVDITQRYLIAECWIPTEELDDVRTSLMRGSIAAGCFVHPILNEIEPNETPPTHFTVNKFTSGFQNIVDAYGIADYKELNPTPWTIISFPFLFAIMFGDVGHAIIMLVFALYLIFKEKKLIAKKIKDEIIQTFFGGRYIILLMGAFSLYTGFIYNDFYARSINVFGSSWATSANNNSCWNWKGLNGQEEWERQAAERNQSIEIMLDPVYCYDADAGPSLILDPIWDLANNKLNFLNSLKMKSAVILGILQMTLGLFISLGNHIHIRSKADVFFVFVPQLLFLCCIFVYICLQIIVKWIAFTAGPAWIFGRFYPGANCAPNLLIGLINMFMPAVGSSLTMLANEHSATSRRIR